VQSGLRQRRRRSRGRRVGIDIDADAHMPDISCPGGATPPISPVADLRPALTNVEGARRYLGGISRALLYAELFRELEVVHLGARTLITVASLDRLIARRRAAEAQR
jgi:hypothetical protein